MGFLKVPEGFIRKASACGVRSTAVGYLRLKCLNEQGFVRYGEISTIGSVLGVSSRTVRRWLKDGVEFGFVYKDGGGYGLVSYDRAYELLGYDMTSKAIKGGKFRRGKFKIFKIDKRYQNNLLPIIARFEAELNMSRQQYMIQIKSTQKMKSGDVDVNMSVALSCRGLAALLGYTSSSTGHRLEMAMNGIGCSIEGKTRLAKLAGADQSHVYLQSGVPICNAPNEINIY